MAVTTDTRDDLTRLRNAVIGSRTKKAQLVAQGKVPGLVELLAHEDAEVIGLAATILASLAQAATPPVLLSLCRAQAVSHILAAIVRLSEQSSPLSGARLSLLSSLLRALRSLLLSLSAHLDTRSRLKRRAGIDSHASLSRSSSPSSSALSNAPRMLNMAKKGHSVREKRDWTLADAGYASSIAGGVPPHEELVLRARLAVTEAFHPAHLSAWLGTLFVARLAASTQGPPAVGLSKRSSSMSLDGLPQSAPGSGAQSPAIAPAKGSSSSSNITSLSASDRTRLLSVVEMACHVLANCLCIPGPPPGTAVARDGRLTHPPAASLPATSPADDLDARRSAVLAFSASQSPYWRAAHPEASAGEDERRTRVDKPSVSQASMAGHGAGGTPFHASLIGRGKSRSVSGERQREASVVRAPMEEVQEEVDEDAAPKDSANFGPDDQVLDALLDAAQSASSRTQEAALWALAELARGNSEASVKLLRCQTASGQLPTSMLLNFRKESCVPVKLAALCCLAHIIQRHPFTDRTNQYVLSALVVLSLDEVAATSATAFFSLAKLIGDDVELQLAAVEKHRLLEAVAKALEGCKNVGLPKEGETPGASADRTLDREGWDVGEAKDEDALLLKEAALTALAAMCCRSDEIRRRVIEHSSPSLLNLVVACLPSGPLGIRIAAIRVVRSLSRSISILRTSLVDASVGETLLGMLDEPQADEEILDEASAAICNVVANFSPMKQVLLDKGGIEILARLLDRTDMAQARLNALWAFKNMLYKSDGATKERIMDAVGWQRVSSLALDGSGEDTAAQEQALCILRNLASGKAENVELALRGLGGEAKAMDLVETVVWQRRGPLLLEQVAHFLANVAAGEDRHRDAILQRPELVDALVFFVAHPTPSVRQAGLLVVLNLTQRIQGSDSAVRAIPRLQAFELDRAVKRLVDDADGDVRQLARAVLLAFE